MPSADSSALIAHFRKALDLPRNPAVLEQRIGRVHRLGQKMPVRVVNFVARGTIEEGMLGVLSFKKSLFAGALDRGEKNVFMGGTRLNRFMKGVEEVTWLIPETPMPATTSEEPSAAQLNGGNAAAYRRDGVQEAAVAPTENPWTGLLEQGAALPQQLAAVSSTANDAGMPAAAGLKGQSFIQRDASTGESYLRIPMPIPSAGSGAEDALGVA